MGDGYLPAPPQPTVGIYMYSPLSWALEMAQLSTNSLQEDTREHLPVDVAMIASDMGPVREMVHGDVIAGFKCLLFMAFLHGFTHQHPTPLVMNCRFTRRFCLIYLIMTFRWSIRALFDGVYIHTSAGLSV